MKQRFIILLAIILALGFTACNSPSEENSLPDNTTLTEYPQEQQEDSSTANEVSDTDEDVAKIETKIDSGRYIGQADSNFIEIKISGVPDDMDPVIFMLSEEVKENFISLDLETEDTIKVEYYVNEANQKVITKVEKI